MRNRCFQLITTFYSITFWLTNVKGSRIKQIAYEKATKEQIFIVHVTNAIVDINSTRQVE